MIKRETVKILNLKPLTKAMCYDFYEEIRSELDTLEGLRESISWFRDDVEKLNHLWWVLNYHSSRLDSRRNLRALIEKSLDRLADLKTDDLTDEKIKE